MKQSILKDSDVTVNEGMTVGELYSQVKETLSEKYSKHAHFDGIVLREVQNLIQQFPEHIQGDVENIVRGTTGRMKQRKLNLFYIKILMLAGESAIIY